ncbi:MAG: hypothetical protein OES13_01660 [Acidimicrobiia bacterium]|nr:hypothetical protein [Acidimicrobiia bacterium]
MATTSRSRFLSGVEGTVVVVESVVVGGVVVAGGALVVAGVTVVAGAVVGAAVVAVAVAVVDTGIDVGAVEELHAASSKRPITDRASTAER